MGVLRLPVVPQFRDRPVLPLRNEDRVVAEALAAASLQGDPALEPSGAAKLAAVGSEEDELGDVAGSSLLDALELVEELRHGGRTLRRIPRRENARAAAEGVHLETGILGQHPAVRVLTPERGLDRRVLVIGRAGLGRVVVAVERLDRPPGQELLELTCFVPVPRAEDDPHYSIHRTSSTPSISATPATTEGVEPAVS